MTRATQWEDLVRDYTRRVWNEHEIAALDEFVPERTLLLHDESGGQYVSRTELKGRVSEVLRNMPDHRLDVHEIVSGGNEVFFQWVNYGHWNDGERGAFPVRFGGITYWKIVDGRIAVRDGLGDIATFAWQIGALPKRLRLLMPV